MKKTIILFLSFAFLAIQNEAQTVTDIDGNVYNTVTIGTQTWMKENLRAIHYNNGDTIPNITDSTQWANDLLGAYCSYNNSINTANIYGKLYNWFTVVDNRKLCPTGWHVPSSAEWHTMSFYLGGGDSAGGALKETDTLHWNNPNVGATNSSGFTGLPGGSRHAYSFFNDIGVWGFWWNTDSNICKGTPSGERCALHNIWEGNGCAFVNMTYGSSVRCLKDTASSHINENYWQNRLQIYPNPFSTSTQISFDKTYQTLDLSLIDLQGKIIQQKSYHDCNKITLDRAGIANGFYFLRVSLDGKFVETKKVIIN